MKEYEIEEVDGKTTELANQMTRFEELLVSYGLPSENVIAPIDERETIMSALPSFLSKMTPEEKREATYLSKFIAGAAIGLFDASLNFVWNEVVVNLRKKIVTYGLDEFFDAAVDEKRRQFYKTEDDLSGIKDITLLDTCKKLEWLSDIVYRKLCHILDMRNQIGASHPTTYNINSYELLGWLKTCVDEVISDKPSNSAITVRKLIENVKKADSRLDPVILSSFQIAIKDLSTNMASNLITSLFGIFVSPKSATIVRTNALEVSKIVWGYCRTETKYDLGEKVDIYRNNLDEEKAKVAESFFEECDGLQYLSLNTRILQISALCDELLAAHTGYNNYYSEPQYAKSIMNYIKVAEDIPEERMEKIINTFLSCRIGREVTYCHGVSPSAENYYNDFFSMLSKKQVVVLLEVLKNHVDSIYNGRGVRCANVAAILETIKSPLLGERLNEIIDYMLDFYSKSILNKVYKDQGFKDLARGILEW